MISVLGQNVIGPNARAVDVEDEGRLVLEVAVEEDLHLVTLAIVAPRNAALDAVGLAVIGANGDIEVLFVIDDVECSCLTRGRPGKRLSLDEALRPS